MLMNALLVEIAWADGQPVAQQDGVIYVSGTSGDSNGTITVEGTAENGTSMFKVTITIPANTDKTGAARCIEAALKHNQGFTNNLTAIANFNKVTIMPKSESENNPKFVLKVTNNSVTGQLYTALQPIPSVPSQCFGGQDPGSFCVADGDCLGGTCVAVECPALSEWSSILMVLSMGMAGMYFIHCWRALG